jgi:hypothetical protein
MSFKQELSLMETDVTANDPEEVLWKGVPLAGRLLREIRERKLAEGVYVKARGRGDLMAQILETAAA